ncbi:MAG: type II 3-dehydroquinate dehydratase [Desulfovibrionaceae bacterium]|nr:type II 3-dehydroquinate dehydratase [Desulfovibrionaceae bacterium]
MKILVLHGVNLNMLGRRDPKFYGSVTLDTINKTLLSLTQELHIELEHFQTNFEGAMVERIQHVLDENIAAIVINAAAWTHTSLAIHDALELLKIPVVEVHLSNIYARENFRQHSLLASVVHGTIAGFGLESYTLGLRAAYSLTQQEANK